MGEDLILLLWRTGLYKAWLRFDIGVWMHVSIGFVVIS
jgi:hypothetical protein